MEQKSYRIDHALHFLNAKIYINKIYYFPDKITTNNHSHSYMELHYITKGSAVYRMEFQDTVELHTDEWLLLGKNIYHEEKIPEQCSGYCMGIDFLQPDAQSPFRVFWNHPYYKCEGNSKIGEIISVIFRELEEKSIGYEEYCRNLLSMLLLQILRSYPEQEAKKQAPAARKEDIVSTIDGYFNRVFNQQGNMLTIDSLAAELNISKRQLSRILQERYHSTFTKMLITAKMKYTEYLLMHTDKSVMEISEICGITDTYLIRSFKRIYNKTPAQYRKSYKKDML